MNESKLEAIAADLLGGTAQVIPIRDCSNGQTIRYLLRSQPAEEIIALSDHDDQILEFITQHSQMCTELIHHGYTGAVAFEVTITTLYDCIELYRAMAFTLLSNGIALKLHIVMVNDCPSYTQAALTVEMGELVALGVELIIDNVTTLEHLNIAQMILSLVEEVRMDLTNRNALSYIHLSSLLSTELTPTKRLGVIIPPNHELPPFSQTFQIANIKH